METPICVADARTLVDNIHDIKRWIYNGQLRLVVPSCSMYSLFIEEMSLPKGRLASEVVAELYQKSQETKPAPKEISRPKSFGKPAKIDYPPFDINPFLARLFLSGLKHWKGEDAASEQRIFFQEKENHEAVSFPQANEQYTPWKDIENEEEEKPQVVEDRPTTWAEALRRKQNIANGIVNISSAAKAPAKPKLVAKAAGIEASPWKIKRDAPKISAKDVPAKLRPLMSCALWRLHESIDRNDSNELFLLSDEAEIQNVAQKLNITARSSKELKSLVAAKAKQPELDIFGDLEQEFGIMRNTRGSDPRSIQTNGDANHTKPEADDSTEKHSGLGDSTPSGQTAEMENSHVIDESGNAESEQRTAESPAKIVQIAKNEDKQTPSKELPADSAISPAKDNASEKSAWNEHSPLTFNDLLQDPKISNGHKVESFVENRGQEEVGATPNASASSPPEETPKPAGSNRDKVDMSSAVPSASTAAMQTPPASVQTEHESEDSDEDVVVFVPQPKRSSVQKKPTQQSSRPSTPLSQPQQQKLAEQAPRPPPVTPQHQARTFGRGRKHIVVSHSHPQPTVAPTVIDPDSFGRSFAVNPNLNSRTLHNNRSHHRPRSSVENALLPPRPREPRHATRPSPPGQSHHQSPRLSPAPKPKDETLRPQSSHKQRVSPQRGPEALENGSIGSRGHGSDHAKAGEQLPAQVKTLNARMVESEEFIPRSAFLEAKLDPIGTPKATSSTGSPDSVPRTAKPTVRVKPKVPEPQTVGSDDLLPRSFVHAPSSEQQMPKPHVFEPNEFVTRNAMPASQYKQRLPEAEIGEPRASMPDVQYVLKSGSTRAATRGRGRLWIPS